MRKFTQNFINVPKKIYQPSNSGDCQRCMELELPRLNLPLFRAELRRDADSRRNGLEIYDILRRRWVALTPEEWVRQHFVHFLVEQRGYPSGLMANEVSLKLNNTSRRADTVVYSRTLQPLAVIEYKAPTVEITASVFEQAVRYNSVTGAPCIILSNGMRHVCAMRKPEGGYMFARDVPSYPVLSRHL